MGKREELQKLKAARKHTPIAEIQTPVENISIVSEEPEIAKKNEASEMPVEAIKVPETENVIPTQQKNVEQPLNASQEAQTKTEEIIPEKVEIIEKQEAVPEQKEVVVDAQFASEQKIVVETSQPVQEERAVVVEVEKTAEKEVTKRTSMALLVGNNKFIRLRSMQLGLSIQNYVNLLIEEEVERQKNQESSMNEDIDVNLDMNYRRGENSTIVALVLKEKNAKFLKRGGAMLGMNSTTFMNHIISEEQKREKEFGPRKGEFDD